MPSKTSPKARKSTQKPGGKQTDRIERNVVAFAEQVGFLIGTVQARTEGWLDRDRLSHVVGQIRDHSAQLLKQVRAMGPSKPSRSKSPSAAKRGRGPVDAPGKHHRKPPPQESITRRMGKPDNERLTAKGMKTGRYRKRG